jgi:hypothetical protein
LLLLNAVGERADCAGSAEILKLTFFGGTAAVSESTTDDSMRRQWAYVLESTLRPINRGHDISKATEHSQISGKLSPLWWPNWNRLLKVNRVPKLDGFRQLVGQAEIQAFIRDERLHRQYFAALVAKK